VATVSLQAYGKHRRARNLSGGTTQAVTRAIRTRRLVASVVYVNGRPKIRDVAQADAEWARNTDHSKAPSTVKAQAAGARPVTSSSSPRDVAPSLADAAMREKNARADLVELEYRMKIGELVPARAVEGAWSEMVTQMRTAVLAVPSKVKTLIPHLTRQELAQLNDLLAQALEALADRASQQ
jgi:phage terminase Nu1 subunit (DNA packaging protein)